MPTSRRTGFPSIPWMPVRAPVDDTIPLPPAARRHRSASTTTLLGMAAVLLLAAGGLILGLAVGGTWPSGFASTPHPVLSLPPDPPSDAPVLPVATDVGNDPGPVAGPAVPTTAAAPSILRWLPTGRRHERGRRH